MIYDKDNSVITNIYIIHFDQSIPEYPLYVASIFQLYLSHITV